MSIDAMKQVWDHSNARGTALVIMLCFADHADENGIAWPSISKLSERARVDRSNIIKKLHALIEMGELEFVKTGFRGVKVYRVTSGKTATRRKNATSRKFAQTSGKTATGTSGKTATRTIIEPPIEPPSKKSAPKKRNDEHPDFQAWYAHYPHKVGVGAARKAFFKAREKASLEDLMAGLQAYIRSKPPDRSWCNPATWLNQERWNDRPQELENGRDDEDAEADRDRRRDEAILREAGILEPSKPDTAEGGNAGPVQGGFGYGQGRA